jgi:hypothetical protein
VAGALIDLLYLERTPEAPRDRWGDLDQGRTREAIDTRGIGLCFCAAGFGLAELRDKPSLSSRLEAVNVRQTEFRVDR